MTAIIIFQWALFFFLTTIQIRVVGLNVFHPNIFYLLFHFICFVLHPTLAESFDFYLVYTYMRFYPEEFVRIRALGIADLGLLCFFAASLFGSRLRSGALPAPIWVTRQYRIDPVLKRSFIVTAAILAPLAIYSMIYWVTHPIVNAAHFGSMSSTKVTQTSNGTVLFTNTTSYVLVGQYMAGTLSVCWALLNRFHLKACLPLIGYLLFRTYDGGARVNFLLLGAACGLVYLVHLHRVWPTRRLIALLGVLLVVFAVLGSDRKLVKKALVGLSPIEQSFEDKSVRISSWSNKSYLDGQDFANYEYLSYITNFVPKETGNYTYFTQYLTLLIKPIPRVIWKDKPERDLVTLFNLNDYGRFDVLTPSLVGDGWMSLGYLGVVITLGTAGWALGSFYRSASLDDRSPFAILTYSFLIGFSAQWFRDGGTSIAVFMGIYLLPIFVWWAVWKWMTPRALALARSRARNSRRLVNFVKSTPADQ